MTQATVFADEGETESLSSVKQYIRFNVGDHVFAVPVSDLMEIVRLPAISPVPMSPPALLGLANMHGSVVPILDLRNIFDIPQRPYSDAARVLVIMLNKPIGVVADRVGHLIGLEEAQIERNVAPEKNAHGLFCGLISHTEGAAMLINFAGIIQREFSILPATVEPADTAYQFNDTQAANEQDDDIRLIAFTVADQEFALEIGHVEEILSCPEKLLQIPHTHASVAGVFSLRNNLIPVFYLGVLLESAASNNYRRLIVAKVQTDGVLLSVGLIVDDVTEVLQIERHVLKDVPKFFGRDNANSEITAIYPLQNGQRLISILSLPSLFGTELIKTLLSSLREDAAATPEAGHHHDAAQTQIVVLRLAEAHYGLPIESIHEIARATEMTAVPKAPDFIAGVINLHGTVVPVVNQRRRFGLADMATHPSQRIIVIKTAGMHTGYLVDSISQILQLGSETFEATPDFILARSKMIKNIAHIQTGQMIMMLDPEELLSSAELGMLTELHAAEHTTES
jgi:purine-binding chemotaxis protein CheW